jgi:hypothetical protein
MVQIIEFWAPLEQKSKFRMISELGYRILAMLEAHQADSRFVFKYLCFSRFFALEFQFFIFILINRNYCVFLLNEQIRVKFEPFGR